MIRITGGKWRGRGIQSPPRGAEIRPTTSLMRESVFNRVQSMIDGGRFLDLFAGSGIMGLEALSRGAAFVLAVEKDPRQIRVLRQNAEALQADESQYRLMQRDAVALAGKKNPDAPFDIVFADPPYGRVDLPALLDALQGNGWVSTGGIILVEHGERESDLPGFERKPFGDSTLSWRRLEGS